MNGRQYRRLDQPCVGERHEVIVAVDQIKLGGMLEDFGDMQIFSNLRIDAAVFFVAPLNYRVEAGSRHRVSSRE